MLNIKVDREKLAPNEEWIDAVLQTITEGIVRIDNRGVIKSFSPGAERITGWLEERVLGANVDEIFRLPDKKEGFLKSLLQADVKCLLDVLTKENQLITLEINIAKKKNPVVEDELTLVMRDISEASEANQLRSYFLASITHEFRTPLSALNASVEFLLSEVDELSKEEISNLLKSIHLSVINLQTLIDNLLESINIKAGRFTVRPKAIRLSSVIIEAKRVMQPLMDRRGQSLVLRQPAQLPKVFADQTRTLQVLVNLLSNASKFSPMETDIHLTLKQENDFIKVSVSDRGPGIPPADRTNLFQRFSRLGAQDGAQYGIGLGLSVVKAIVEEQGGEVGIGERPGGGSIFWFTILKEKAL